MTMENQTQSDRLRSVLKEQQISVLGFAIRLGTISPNQLYSILHGEKEMSAEIAERINGLLPQYSVQWLLNGESE